MYTSIRSSERQLPVITFRGQDKIFRQLRQYVDSSVDVVATAKGLTLAWPL
jgi:hypothetical protein